MIKPAAFTMHLKELQYIVSILLLYEMCFYDMLVKEWTSLFFFLIIFLPSNLVISGERFFFLLFIFVVPGIEAGSLHMLGKHSMTELHPLSPQTLSSSLLFCLIHTK